MRRVAVVTGSAFVLAVALAGAVSVVRSGDADHNQRALAPLRPSVGMPSVAVSQPPAAVPEPVQPTPDGPGGEPAPYEAPQAPAAPPPIDWNLLVASVKATRNAALNGGAGQDVPAGLKAAGELVTDAVMYATYSGDGERILSGLLSSLNGADLPAIAAAPTPQLPELTAPDFSGLSEAYAAMSSRPSPMGVTGPPPYLPPPQASWSPPPADAALSPLPGGLATPTPTPDLSFLMQPPPPTAPIWLTLPGLSQTPGLPS